ncbi:MAG: hypothetical protein HXS46_09355 [Theionarchaea archaeon]|nr:MAG: hypothetical protein AYK18_16420 [Theionarchaea archaeon DG-70]MBU7010885.1 hypothetical protein [Theionarchaea archaeon]
MKKEIFAVFVSLVIFTSFVGARQVPRVAIIHPKQVKVFIHPDQCKDVELPVIPNGGVIYLQVYTSIDTNALYIEFNGIPIAGYDPQYGPDRFIRIPIYISDEEQGEVAIIGVAAENEYGINTVYAAFIPVEYNPGDLGPGIGCSTMY